MKSLADKYKSNQLVNDVFSLENQVNVSYGNHRSGWSFVMDNLAKLGNNNKGYIFSSFIERDFGWGFSEFLPKYAKTGVGRNCPCST